MLNQQQYQKLQNMGLSARQMQQVLNAAGGVEQRKSLGGFIGNTVKSGGRFVGDIASGLVNVLNPNIEQNTIANIADLVGDTGVLAGNALRGLAGKRKFTDEEMANLPSIIGGANRAQALGQFYKDRYGSGENILNTLYNDPVGVLGDLSTVVGGTGALVKGAGNLARAGKVASVGSKIANIGRAIDPLSLVGSGARAVGKGAKAVTRPVANLAKRVSASTFMDDIAKELAVRQTQANKTQLANFRTIGNEDLGAAMQRWGAMGGPQQNYQRLTNLIDNATKNRNSLVRSGQNVSIANFIDDLKKQAMALENGTDLSDEAFAAATALKRRALQLQRRAERYSKANNIPMGQVPINVIADTQSSTFGKVPQNVMLDPTTFNTNKLFGGQSIGYLENVAPGSQALGKELQKLMTARDIIGTQQHLGRGAQILNILKPATGGAVAGGIVGGLPGLALGAAAQYALNNPTSQGNLAKIISSVSGAPTSRGMRSTTSPRATQLNSTLGNIVPQIYSAGKTTRVANPPAMTREDKPQSIKLAPTAIDFAVPKNAFETPKRQKISVPRY